MRTTFLPFVLATVLLASGVRAEGQIAVVRGTLAEKQDPDREGRGVRGYLKTVTQCLDDAGLVYDVLTDEDVEAGKLSSHKLAMFPYNPQHTDKETEQLAKFIEGGGKAFLFYSIDEKIAAMLGLKLGSHVKETRRGDFASIKFQPDVLKGLPDSVAQMSWNVRVVSTGEGARVIATWRNDEGKDSPYPAVVLSDKGLYMSHVLLPEDIPAKGRFLFACVAHFLPQVWEEAAARCIEGIGKFASFARIEDLKARLDAETQARQVPDVAAQLMAQAQEKKKQAEALAAEKKYDEAIAAATEARDAADQVYSYLVPPREGECRAVWIPSKPWTTWDETMKNLKENGFNAAFPVMCNGYEAHYQSDMLPPSKLFQESGDQLKPCLEAGRKYGIEVHVWRVNWRASQLTQEQEEKLDAEKRLQVDVEGKKADSEGGRWLCPSNPVNQKWETDAMLEIVRKYHPDGIHFDYIRYPGARFCYCDGCRERFGQAAGKPVADWPKEVRRDGPRYEEFNDWRRDQITRTVAAVSEAARKLDPTIKISAAVFRNWESDRYTVGQDWKVWCERHYLDFICPMDYTDKPDRFTNEVTGQVGCVDNVVPLYPGIGAFSSAASFRRPSQLLHQIEIARGLGGDGFLIFHYNEELARRFFPALRLSATSSPTFVPHHAPEIAMESPEPVVPNRPRTYRAGDEVKLRMRFAKGVMGSMQYESAEGRKIASLDAVLEEDQRERSITVTVAEGRSRVAIYGHGVAPNGTPLQYAWRSPVIVGLSAQEVEDIELRAGPPRVPGGEGIRVGVVGGGYGSASLLSALKAEANMRVFPVYNFIPESIAACDVIVLPQLKEPTALDEGVRMRLREFVERGGGLVVTHDALGYRQHVAIVPEVASKGIEHPKSRGCKIAAEHPITKGIEAGQAFEHMYSDHVVAQPGEKGTVVVSDADGKPVVVAGEAGGGRYVANGMATGLGDKNEDAPIGEVEKKVLINSVRWAGKAPVE